MLPGELGSVWGWHTPWLSKIVLCVCALESIINEGIRARGWIPQGPGCA